MANNSNEVIAEKVRRTFAVHVSSDDLSEDSGLAFLLDDLCSKFDRGGVPKELAAERKKIEENLKEAKIQYMEQVVLYDAINDVLTEEEFKDVKSFKPEDKLYEDLRKKLDCIESCDYLKGFSHDGDSDSPLLLGLSSESIVKSSPEISQEDLLNKVIPRVEKVFFENSKAIMKILQKEGDDEDDVLKLEEKVEELVTKLKDEKEKLFQAKSKLIHAFQKWHEAFCAEFKETIYLLNGKYLHKKTKFAENRMDSLTTKCKALGLKAKVFNAEVMCKLYTSETIEELRRLRDHLEMEEKLTNRELASVTGKLHMYESIGGEFDKVVEEYTRLKEQLTEHQKLISD